jgi:hypothetical protein
LILLIHILWMSVVTILPIVGIPRADLLMYRDCDHQQTSRVLNQGSLLYSSGSKFVVWREQARELVLGTSCQRYEARLWLNR